MRTMTSPDLTPAPVLLIQTTFAGELGQDAGGVARDMLSALTQQLCSPATGLFRRVGPQGSGRLYPAPGACDPAQARRYKLLGQVMAKVMGVMVVAWAVCEWL